MTQKYAEAPLGLPAGYVRIPWSEAVPGMEVYLLSIGEDRSGRLVPAAYGPYAVQSRWWLRARTGGVFSEMTERLLVAEVATAPRKHPWYTRLLRRSHQTK